MRVVVAVLVGLTSLVVFATPAGACSCEAPSPKKAFDRSGAVFVGTVTEAPTFDGGSSAAPALSEFDVERVYKGDVSERQGVVTPISGASCGFELSAGERVLVFAGERPSWQGALDGARWYGNLCNGTSVLDAAAPAWFGRGLRAAPGADLPGGGDDATAELVAFALAGLALVGSFVIWRRRATIRACPPSGPRSSPPN